MKKKEGHKPTSHWHVRQARAGITAARTSQWCFLHVCMCHLDNFNRRHVQARELVFASLVNANNITRHHDASCRPCRMLSTDAFLCMCMSWMIPAAYRLCFGMFRLILAVLVIILGVLFSCYDDTSYHTTGSTYNETADVYCRTYRREGYITAVHSYCSSRAAFFRTYLVCATPPVRHGDKSNNSQPSQSQDHNARSSAEHALHIPRYPARVLPPAVGSN